MIGPMEIAQMIDHTLLKPETSSAMISQGATRLGTSAGVTIVNEMITNSLLGGSFEFF